MKHPKVNKLSTSTNNSNSKTRREKRCRVCGGIAQSFNFNGLSCESCKTFFRRNAYKHEEFVCFNKERCDVNLTSRRFCKRCRLNKCIAIGMKKELIKSSSNSTASSNEGEVQNKSITSSVSPSPSLSSSLSSLSQTPVLTLTTYEAECLEMVKKISAIFVERPEQPRKVIGFAADLRSLFSVQTVFFEAVAAVAGATLPGFDFLPWEERLSVLAEAVPKIMFFRTAYYFHFELNSFIVRVDPLKSNQSVLVSLEMFYGPKLDYFSFSHREFAHLVAELVEQDETVKDFITILLLCQQKKQKQEETEKVSFDSAENNKSWTCILGYTYAKYVHLLRRYLAVKLQNELQAERKTSKLLALIEDEQGPMKRLLGDLFSGFDFKLWPYSEALRKSGKAN